MNDVEVSLVGLIPENHRLEALRALTPDGIVQELLEVMAPTCGFDGTAIDSMKRSILAREREATTGIGNRVAIPHMKNCSAVETVCGAFGRSEQGVEWAAPDGALAHLFFLILTPDGQESRHVQLMRKIVRVSHDPKTVNYLISTSSFSNLQAIFQEVDAERD